MAVTVNDLKAFVGSDDTTYDALLQECLNEAMALVDKYNVKYDAGTETWIASDAPTVIVDRCYLAVAADLFERRNAPNGIASQQYATADGIGINPYRVGRDPMSHAYKILGRWVTPW